CLGPSTLNGSLLHLFWDMEIATTIVVRSVVTLQIGDQLSERLTLLRHNIGKEQTIQHAITFRKKARVTYTSRLFAADQNLFFHHQICNVLEADACFVQFAAVLRSDAVQHA